MLSRVKQILPMQTNKFQKSQFVPKSDSQEEEEDLFEYYYNTPGSAPGTLGIAPDALPTEIVLIDYTAEQATEYSSLTPEECLPYLNTESVSWIDVRGLGSEKVLRRLGSVFKLPDLILEDIVNVPQRPKLENHPDYVLIVTQMVMPKRKEGFWIEQISFILGEHYLLTVQEEPERDPFFPVKRRIHNNLGTIRQRGINYLTYALIDAIIDGYFPVLEHYGERLEDLEDEVVDNASEKTLGKIYRIRRELLALKRAIWPQREVFNALLRDGSPYMSAEVLHYLRDCYDHTVQIIDVIQAYRELASGLLDVYLSVLSHRMNEVMKLLTIISTIFIPLTFIAGIYGMNFNPEKSPFNMPELNWYWGYVFCLALMTAIAAVQVYFFWQRGWFKKAPLRRQQK